MFTLCTQGALEAWHFGLRTSYAPQCVLAWLCHCSTLGLTVQFQWLLYSGFISECLVLYFTVEPLYPVQNSVLASLYHTEGSVLEVSENAVIMGGGGVMNGFSSVVVVFLSISSE